MKLRLLPVAALIVCSSAIVSAESDNAPVIKEDYVNLLRVDLRAAKAEIVTNSLELSSEELARFWPIYHEYDLLLTKLNSERVATLRDYSAHYASIGDAQAEQMTQRSFDFQHKRLALLKKYYERVAKTFNPATAARFVQIEHQLLMLVDVQIASELPLIPRQAILNRLEAK